MKATIVALGLVASLGFAGTVIADDSGCVVHYKRTACQGQEAVSFKKCDGNAECDKTKAADSAEACAAAALKSCSNSRLDITKYKVITAKGAGLPPGDYKLSVSPPIPDAPMGAGPMLQPMKEYPNFPQRYRDHKTSGLMLTVPEEGTTMDIDMKP